MVLLTSFASAAANDKGAAAGVDRVEAKLDKEQLCDALSALLSRKT